MITEQGKRHLHAMQIGWRGFEPKPEDGPYIVTLFNDFANAMGMLGYPLDKPEVVDARDLEDFDEEANAMLILNEKIICLADAVNQLCLAMDYYTRDSTHQNSPTILADRLRMIRNDIANLIPE